ncbi:gamma-glutamyl-gamma-aminobutyrate hydrolase family protein [Paucibacter sp. APW11]|uniref:Gamma-glutamyl-gamma-aminobutyrate hydrolase family protein n=1 Tax=Roseateles aquae TaxID=3077235 RepID=A0ABU3P721_9BURK|nr:gamma-glutamyl-gamma-aminobutyrate hydrolase family protein [Paucibacter sp. APW11]MDT8997883.1 gamma-glutamyl-gamma-aminobutyrate hydrolase family protein [Paucibacter sp. APW11]
MGAASAPPVVLLPADHRRLGEQRVQLVVTQYVEAVRLAGCLPLVVPAARPEELEVLLEMADGVLLTGSPSNVHPSHFGEPVHDESLPLDPARDAWTLPLIRLALQRGVPLLGICRGFQEVNVALGGSLHQAVQEQPGLQDHRARPAPATLAEQYSPAHEIAIAPDGLLGQLLPAPRLLVNSLHGQGIKRLADGLQIEARADDGLIEAFSVPGSAGFALCLQWHPEWQAADNPASMQLLSAFGAACRQRQREREREHQRHAATLTDRQAL